MGCSSHSLRVMSASELTAPINWGGERSVHPISEILTVSIAISEKWESALLKGTLTGAELATVANDLILNCLETLDSAFPLIIGCSRWETQRGGSV